MLSIYSSTFIFPFDRRRGKLKTFSGWKFNLWLCNYSLAVIYYAQGLLRFTALLLFRPEDVVLLHLPAQINAIVVPWVFHIVITMIFCLNADLLAMLFNEMFDDGSSDGGSKPHRRFMQLPVKEQLVSFIGIAMCGCITFYGLIVAFLNDMSHLLINVECLQFLQSSAIALLLTTLLEMWSVSMWALKMGFLMSWNCLVMSKLESTLNKLCWALRYKPYE